MTRKGLTFCNRCKVSFEEDSKTCPRCDKKDEVGHIKSIPEEFRDQFYQRELRKSKARLGL